MLLKGLRQEILFKAFFNALKNIFFSSCDNAVNFINCYICMLSPSM